MADLLDVIGVILIIINIFWFIAFAVSYIVLKQRNPVKKTHKRKRIRANSKFDRQFNRHYGDTWIVIRCEGVRKLQAQRDVIAAIEEVEKEHGIPREYEIKISRSVISAEREEWD